MLDEAIENGGVTVQTCKEIQNDVLDVQARESLKDMIACATQGKGDLDLDLAFVNAIF